MFDDPKKELRRLEAELRALEPEEEFPEAESFPEEDEEDFGPGSNPAVDFTRMCYDDEEAVDDHALLKQKKGKRSKKVPKQKKDKKKDKKKKRPLGGQILLAFLEIWLIYVILRWWLQWIG